jgi:opacity protein-like surface antigen
MMKKLAILAIAMFFLSLSPRAYSQGFKAGILVAYNSVNDSAFKDAYGSGSVMFGVSLSADIVKKLELRAEIHYFSVKGEMTLSKEEITYTLMPIVAGLRFRVFETKRISPYLGAGIDFCSYKEKVPARFGGDITGSKTGIHGEVGTYVHISQKLQIDINFRYLSAKTEVLDKERELGGIRAGVGLEYRF